MTKRRIAFLLVKVAIAAAILAAVFHKVDASHVWACVRDADRLPIFIGIPVGLLTIVIAGWRWHRWLSIFAIDIPLASLICIAQIGQFFLMFLPGPSGDDLTRMLYISRLAPGRVGEAVTSVVLDRLVGLASILGLAAVCIPWQWQLLATSHETHLLALVVLGAGVAASTFGAVFFIAGHPSHRWFERRLRSLPAFSFRDELARIWGLLCANKGIVAQLIGAAVGTQLLLCVFFSLAGLAVGIHVPITVWMTFIPIVLAASALPITIAGFGVREYLLVLFLGVTAQVQSERALAASVVVFSMILAIALIGGLVYIFYRPARKAVVVDESVALARTGE